jgi:lipopolysaccharide transport system permease protein
MWQYRELIANLTITDLKNRYQNTTLGFFWSILSPLLLALVLYFVFRTLFKQEENFAVNLLVGIMAWRFFAIGTTSAMSSIVNKPSLITKVYIPRQILVLSNTLSSIISSLLEMLILIPIIFVILGHVPATLPLFLVIHFLYFWLVFGVGLLLASLYVYLRDLNQIWDVLVNILFFCSPIIYPLSTVPDYLRPYYMLNPLTRIITLYREVMVDGTLPSLNHIAVVIGFGLAAYLVGVLAFGRLQRRFAEEI